MVDSARTQIDSLGFRKDSVLHPMRPCTWLGRTEQSVGQPGEAALVLQVGGFVHPDSGAAAMTPRQVIKVSGIGVRKAAGRRRRARPAEPIACRKLRTWIEVKP